MPRSSLIPLLSCLILMLRFYFTLGFSNAAPTPPHFASTAAASSHEKGEDCQQNCCLKVETTTIRLSQVSAEWMTCRPPSNGNANKNDSSSVSSSCVRPPLLFLHGSFHASWCWAEHYMPYFASRGYTCYALSLRGTGGTYAGQGVKKVKIEQHVQDITDAIAYIQQEQKQQQLVQQERIDEEKTRLQRLGGKSDSTQNDDDRTTESRTAGTGSESTESATVTNDRNLAHSESVMNVKPVLIAHSFGGLAVMKYLEKNLLNLKEENPSPPNNVSSVSQSCLGISGVVSMCSVPPSGNGKMTMRFLKRSLRDSWKITAGLAMKKCIRDKNLCRELFFDQEGISDVELERFQKYFERDTVATIDLMDLAKQLPSVHTDERSGRAVFWGRGGNEKDGVGEKEEEGATVPVVPSLVIGATDDFIVDREGVEELARYYGVKPVMVQSAHDVMLGPRWRNGAEAILKFLEQQQKNFDN